jgi:hypothetical protein
MKGRKRSYVYNEIVRHEGQCRANSQGNFDRQVWRASGVTEAKCFPAYILVLRLL